jgi:hypothetical protein
LEFLDQAALELLRATGRGQLMQCVWVYEHPFDDAGFERFHRNLYASLGSRLIERSPLPFGRPRWVQPVGPPPPVHVAQHSRPRTELMDWADELTSLPIDPERGPGWHLAVQRLDDGSTAASIVASHVIGDGVGALMAVFEGITGNIRETGYERPDSRTRGQALGGRGHSRTATKRRRGHSRRPAVGRPAAAAAAAAAAIAHPGLVRPS